MKNLDLHLLYASSPSFNLRCAINESELAVKLCAGFAMVVVVVGWQPITKLMLSYINITRGTKKCARYALMEAHGLLKINDGPLGDCGWHARLENSTSLGSSCYICTPNFCI